MRVPITLPDLGDVARLSLWSIRPGEDLRDGDRVAEVTIPGVMIDIPAPVDGILAERFAHVGDTLAAGKVIGLIETGSSTS